MKYIHTGLMEEGFPPLNVESTRKHYYGDKAKLYNKDREESDKWLMEHQAVHNALQETTGKVLDIPCGTGRFITIYEELGLDFIGMDVSEEMMVQARELDPKAEIIHGDIMSIPLEDKSVESSVCLRLLNLMTEEEMAEGLLELGRVTKERLIFGLFTGNNLERHPRHWVHRMSKLKNAVNAAGFKIEGFYNIRDNIYNVWRCVSR